MVSCRHADVLPDSPVPDTTVPGFGTAETGDGIFFRRVRVVRNADR